ncbi:MAG TPA: helix-turn-helix domain-containing GNAT family N-acetyltransferase [Cryptosporangiaceae bacterium]|nr:helix-turn-helix domain-containing GNAT family N-acetyltransferase [Cryptosporangiaceae bacterium]
MSDDPVATVRAFNRFYTGVIGVLDDGLLRTPYSLTEARVLFELAQRDTTEVLALRRALGLDPGYLSRLLARLDADGLVTRDRSDSDARRQVVRLTPRGREVFALLDERSAAETGALLDRLDGDGRRRLTAAMQTIHDLLSNTSPASTVTLRPLGAGDLGWVVQRHGVLYAQEYGWDLSFEALVARIVADYAEHHDPRREAAWIAEADGTPAGCVFCVRKDDRTAQLRLLLVEPTARGAGVGSRLVEQCLSFAKTAGYDRITLWTNDVLTAARRLYERAGFTLVASEPHHSFGHGLVGQHWERSL